MSRLHTDDLARFTGSEQWFPHHFNQAVVYTEDIQYLMEEGKAYWLIDAIAIHLESDEFREAAKLDKRIGLMHFWNLAVRPDRTATLQVVADSGEQPFIRQEIPFTDFSLETVDVWAASAGTFWTLLLPSEY